MELRVLRYFLAVAREESISAAAEALNLTQPTLSRQLMDLEEELGVKLFHRGRRNRSVTLTEAGMFLRKHAEEIVLLADKTESAFNTADEEITGDVYIAAGETDATRLLARAARILRDKYPQVHYHITSGDGTYVEEQLDKGLADFGLVLGPANAGKYEVLTMPFRDEWGVLLWRSNPMAEQESIRPEDLWDKNLILSRQATSNVQMLKWLGKELSELHIVATYSLAYNASLMTEEGLGYTLTLDRIINTTGDSILCFRPLEPRLEMEIHLVWKKYQVFSRAAELFLEQVRELLEYPSVP